MVSIPKTKTAEGQIAFQNLSEGVAIKIPQQNHSFASQIPKRFSQKMDRFSLRVSLVSLKT